MRAKYYALTLRQMSFKKPFVFLFIFIFLLIVIFYTFSNKIRPAILKVSENSARNIAVKCTNDAVYKNIENVKYENLVTINKDNNGKVTSLSANSLEINKLTTSITNDVEKNLQDYEEGKITLPLGIIFSENVVSGYGPKITLKTFPLGDVKGEIKSKFESAGINQTRHSLIFEVTSDVKVLAPFVSEIQEYTNSVVIAETIIVSETPSSYYNISGVENIDKKDTLAVVE